MSEAPNTPVQTEIEKKVQTPPRKPKRQPAYNVILLDDDQHTVPYVLEMLAKLFGHNETKALQMAEEVHTTGRVIVDTTTMERAELKHDQIHAYGPGPEYMSCKGSMRATIEPVV